MKKDIHPAYDDAVVKCACGHILETRSTKKEIHVEVCSKCHGFSPGSKSLLMQLEELKNFRGNTVKTSPNSTWRYSTTTPS